MKKDHIREILKKYIPEKSLDLVCNYLTEHPVQLVISRDRSTKSGDYRAPHPRQHYHRISINHSLNPYQFLITLVHELAHMHAFLQFGRGIKPHGKEWQASFINLMRPVIESGSFPNEMLPVIIRHLRKGYASTFSDNELRKVLDAKNDPAQQKTHLDDIPEGSLFMLSNGRKFIKGELLRKRFRCIDTENKREYRVHGLAEVKIIAKP